MKFTLKYFNELTVDELYAFLQLRSEIFCVEQNCVYQDLDNKDQKALHLMGYDDSEKLVSYARILVPGVAYKEASIGRVVLSAAHRGKGSGKELMQRAIDATLKKLHVNEIVISGQQYLEKFYNDLGFVTESEPYVEDHIMHIKMQNAI